MYDDAYPDYLPATHPSLAMDSADLHAAAIAVVKRYEDDGYPFVLCLRSYFVFAVIGDDAAAETYLLQDYLATRIYGGIGVLSIHPREARYDVVNDTEGALRSSRYYKRAGASLRPCPSLALEDAQWQGTLLELIARAAIVVVDYTWGDGAGLTWELETCLSIKADRTIVVYPDARAPHFSEVRPEQVSKFTRLVSAAHVTEELLFYHPLTHDLFLSTQQIAMTPDEERRQVRFETPSAPAVTYHGTMKRLLELGDYCYEHGEYDFAGTYWSRMPSVFLHRLRHNLSEKGESDIYAVACLRLVQFWANTDLDMARGYLRNVRSLRRSLSPETLSAIDSVVTALGPDAAELGHQDDRSYSES
jgi:hypothetical protein